MRKLALLTLGFVGLAGVLLALQQKYPNAPAEVVFENDKVVVQRAISEAGKWTGEHSHAGNQLVVILKGGTTTFKEGGEEREQTGKAGDVVWVDAVEAHDHKEDTDGEFILITIK